MLFEPRFAQEHPIEFAMLCEILGEPALVSLHHARWGGGDGSYKDRNRVFVVGEDRGKFRIRRAPYTGEIDSKLWTNGLSFQDVLQFAHKYSQTLSK